MHSSEAGRRSQRRRPELNINTSAAASRVRDAAAAKPPVPPKGKPPVSSRALRVRPSTSNTSRDSQGSFLEDDSLVDLNQTSPELPRHQRQVRDSHDLSYPTRQITRDSLLGNMLNSLDQFSLGQMDTAPRPLYDQNDDDDNRDEEDDEEDDDPYGVPRTDGFTRSMTNTSRPLYSSVHGHGHSHGHGYSYSSDYDGADDAASRISSQFSRGRRSNSSSGFQTSLGRINSLSQRNNPAAMGMWKLHSRGGKTSKSSSTNSIDAGGYAQVLATQRWTHGLRGRSSSFDCGQRRPSLDSPSGWKSEFSNTFLVDDYESAPNPTVPGGPSRPARPAIPAMPSAAPPSEPGLRSSDRKKGNRSRSGTMDKTTQSSRYGSFREPAPPLPPFDMDSAPAPNVGYEKTKDGLHGGASSAPQPKERPGFFSRLFGSSRNAPQMAETTSAPATSTTVESIERNGSRSRHIASQMKPLSAPPTRDTQQPVQPPHVVQKKSSFFRRRKKSIAEPPVPVPPVPIPAPIETGRTKEVTIPKPEPSPVSSLRQVMTPYLRGSASGTPSGHHLAPRRETASRTDESEAREDESGRRVRGFSPEYDPSPSATIRTVKSTSALKNQETLGSSRWQGHMESPARSPPEVPTKTQSSGENATFLSDSSDEGDKTPSRGKTTAKSPRGGKTSLPSEVPRSRVDVPKGPEQLSITIPGQSHAEPSPALVLQTNKDTEGSQTRTKLGLPTEPQSAPGGRPSRPDFSRSASSVPSFKVDKADNAEESSMAGNGPLDEPEVAVGEPTEDDRQKAQRIFDGNEDFIQKEKAASWMGEEGPVRQRTLIAYMDLYDFANQSVLSALRQICSRLVFRAETQQVDRILVAFSRRWVDCNPNYGFKTTDVIHTMCYSIMLLNTDLHLADIDQKMTRSQFVKNTMTTIKSALADSAPEAFNNRASILPEKGSLLSPTASEPAQSASAESERPSWRSSFKPPPRSESQLGSHPDSGISIDACGPLVRAPFEGSMRAWEGQVEIVLKDIYTSIRDEKLPLFGADPNHQQPPPQQSSGLSVMGMLKRSPSVLSKAPSEGQASMRGRVSGPDRSNGGRWSSKSRSRPRMGGNGFSSSRTSFEDGNSIWSPTLSSATWSRYSLGRTQTSMSMDSFGSAYPHGDFKQSIGFANALSQAIIREDGPPVNSAQSVMSEEIPDAQLLEDESLELLGPPWIKEANVIHKHHLDGVDKKAKDRNWTEVFAVVQKGQMSLFSFSSKSLRSKARAGRKHAAGAVVGGGNWQENATSVGSFSLRQTLASALPSPGYSRSRPHVWALSLPSGAVHLFQVGTPEISKEFVLTVNYWSARLSTHPLVGGISNVEYGWSEACVNNALVNAINDSATPPPRPGSAAAGRASMHSRQGSRQSSLRSSFDNMGNSSGSRASANKLPGDRIHIAEWTPPSQSLRPSSCGSEAEQLAALLRYLQSTEAELQQHNQLRSPMLLAFSPRGQNSARAMANWERKSSYLLREIVKFRTYVDCLQLAGGKRADIMAERETARRAARGEDVESVGGGGPDEAEAGEGQGLGQGQRQGQGQGQEQEEGGEADEEHGGRDGAVGPA
ncbi:hypothetical protein GGR56DRAFT_524100 [Xylariaceae sp. FL0804]|nr:hypothetical protein GGR56DRAFT_524100 [Xylariaceae sp. FL0804]